MQLFKTILIFLVIVVSLLPVYLLYRYLQRVMRPRESMRRFLAWVIAVLALIFVYTFLLVLFMAMLFPGA